MNPFQRPKEHLSGWLAAILFTVLAASASGRTPPRDELADQVLDRGACQRTDRGTENYTWGWKNSPERPYHPTPDRSYDLQHIRIDIDVDLRDRSVSGRVTHTLAPLSSRLERLVLDCSDTEVHSVRLKGAALSFQQHPGKLWIELDQAYGWEDTLEVAIDYTAHPRLGLYFVQPDSVYPTKHLQAWTQGEDMDNHHWIPVWDYPNDKATFECILTVDSALTAISNGELLGVRKEGDKRTFHWRENHPMVTYLISFAVGDYKKVSTEYEGLPVGYWVYQEHSRADALRSFGRTPEMIAFFNRVTDYPYPYEKYDQVLIEDFMWGGMENITLSHQTDRTMHTEGARPHHSSDGLVAHELAHQWYGDLLTTRNWANAWLNEGFATFMTYLWFEYDRGTMAGEYLRFQHIRAVRAADRAHRRPVVEYHYNTSMELFDSNIYAKGSLILNMLRQSLGEEAFLRTLRHYTASQAYRNVETGDLKKAFEQVTGRNLDWFFDQWVYRPGLPALEVDYKYSRHSELLQVNITQTQDPESTSLFKLPLTIAIDDGRITRYRIFFDSTRASYTFPCARPPRMVLVDEGWQIPKYLTFSKTTRELIYQLEQAPHILDRIRAAGELAQGRTKKSVTTALEMAIGKDPFWGVRVEAVRAYGKLKPRQGAAVLMELAAGQDPRVAEACLRALGNYEGEEVTAYLLEILRTSDKDYVRNAALQALIKVDYDSALAQLDWALKTDSHGDIIRRTAIGALSEQKTAANYRRLVDLAAYGGTTWEARTTAVDSLSRYVDTYPEIMDLYVDYLKDPNRRVRWSAAEQVSRRGKTDHLEALVEMAADDLVGTRVIQRARRNLEQRLKSADRPKEQREIKAILERLEK